MGVFWVSKMPVKDLVNFHQPRTSKQGMPGFCPRKFLGHLNFQSKRPVHWPNFAHHFSKVLSCSVWQPKKPPPISSAKQSNLRAQEEGFLERRIAWGCWGWWGVERGERGKGRAQSGQQTLIFKGFGEIGGSNLGRPRSNLIQQRQAQPSFSA